MITFLFWNTKGHQLQNIIMQISDLHNIDVILLAECQIPIDILLATLNSENPDYFYLPSITKGRIEIYSKFSAKFITPVFDRDHLTIRKISLPGIPELLIAVVHLASKMYMSEEGQSSEAIEIANDIRKTEDERKIGRTILVGDLNMNPFEVGVMSANGFHGVSSKLIASKEKRIVQKKEFPFFYNPMWNFLGDMTSGPPGTFYYNKSDYVSYFWNMFDQVLIRPQLINNLHDIKILTDVEGVSLLDKNGIPKDEISDHLPIIFKLNI